MLRLIALSLAMLMLAQPAIEWLRMDKPRLVLLVDRSASMNTLDRYEDSHSTRIAMLKEILTSGEKSLVETWEADYELELIVFDNQVSQLSGSNGLVVNEIQLLQSTEASSAGTRMGDAVDYALRELPGPTPVAIVLLSDGIATRGQSLEEAASRARRMRVPLYTVAIGSEKRPPDVAVESVMVEETVFPGDRVQVEATVRAIGFEREPTELILRDGESKRVLARTPVELPSDEATKSVSVVLQLEKPGKLNLECLIEPLSQETNIENNLANAAINIRDEKIRVLLVDSQPSYEYRALKSLLERDPAVDLRVHLQEADADYYRVDRVVLKKFPAAEQELFAYDVVFLSDVDLGLLPRSVWPLIERFVSVQGGGLVVVAGPKYMPFAYRGNRSLELLLPVEIDSLNPLRSQLGGNDSFAVAPTQLGWRSPSLQLGQTREDSERIWQTLPPVNWLMRVQDIKPGAQVLAEHPVITNRQGQRLPVILRQYVGAGEVVFHATDETWRWRWRTDDRYFARYWGQVVRRLGRGRLATGRQGVLLTTDRTRYEPNEPVQLQVRFRNPANAPAADEVVVQVRGESVATQRFTLSRQLGRRGVFVARLERLQPDRYDAILMQPEAGGDIKAVSFEIDQPPQELARTVVDRQILRQAAETTGGQSFTAANVSELTAALPRPQRQRLDQTPPRKLWNSNVLMAIFVICLTAEWFVRRRHGML